MRRVVEEDAPRPVHAVERHHEAELARPARDVACARLAGPSPKARFQEREVLREQGARASAPRAITIGGASKSGAKRVASSSRISSSDAPPGEGADPLAGEREALLAHLAGPRRARRAARRRRALEQRRRRAGSGTRRSRRRAGASRSPVSSMTRSGVARSRSSELHAADRLGRARADRDAQPARPRLRAGGASALPSALQLLARAGEAGGPRRRSRRLPGGRWCAPGRGRRGSRASRSGARSADRRRRTADPRDRSSRSARAPRVPGALCHKAGAAGGASQGAPASQARSASRAP